MPSATPSIDPGTWPGRRLLTNAVAVVVMAIAVLATLVVPAAPPAAAAGKPTMLVYGDSITAEMRSQLTYVGSAGFEITVNTYGGTSLCDWVPQILRDAVPGTRLVGLAFTGNWFTPCMRPGGVAPDEATAAAIYRSTLDELIPVLNARGVAVMLIGAPPSLALDGSTIWSYVNTVYPQAAIDWRARGADVVYTDAGRRSLATPEGLWTKTMPCLPFETAAMGCTGGRIVVRAPDTAHFCPTSDDPCSVWASGAWRYATAVNDAAVFRVRPTMGYLDYAVGGVNRVDVGGWAIDPDNDTGPTAVHVYIDGAGYALRADGPRSDLGALFPLAGPNHGYRRRCPPRPACTTCAPTPSTSAPAGPTASSAAAR